MKTPDYRCRHVVSIENVRTYRFATVVRNSRNIGSRNEPTISHLTLLRLRPSTLRAASCKTRAYTWDRERDLIRDFQTTDGLDA